MISLPRIPILVTALIIGAVPIHAQNNTQATKTAARDSIHWEKNLETALSVAQKQDKLILCFLLLGDLDAPDC